MDGRLLTSDSGVLLILKLHKRSVMVFGMQEMTPESADGLEVARQTIKNHFDKIARLYEHGTGIERIGRYVKGWWQWVHAGVDVIVQSAEELWKLKWDVVH